jgi:hypothetical protein
VLYLSYPVSWAITAATHFILSFLTLKKETKKIAVLE